MSTSIAIKESDIYIYRYISLCMSSIRIMSIRSSLLDDILFLNIRLLNTKLNFIEFLNGYLTSKMKAKKIIEKYIHFM